MDRIKKLTLVLLWGFSHASCTLGACKLPVLLPQIVCFYNPSFPQCLPVKNVSCKCFVSDHLALHKPGLVERKSVQARNVLTIHG